MLAFYAWMKHMTDVREESKLEGADFEKYEQTAIGAVLRPPEVEIVGVRTQRTPDLLDKESFPGRWARSGRCYRAYRGTSRLRCVRMATTAVRSVMSATT